MKFVFVQSSSAAEQANAKLSDWLLNRQAADLSKPAGTADQKQSKICSGPDEYAGIGRSTSCLVTSE